MKTFTLVIAFCFLLFSSINLKADCTIASTINASVFLATYSGCTGTMTIPNGVDLVIDVDLTMPTGVTRLVIASGGQIIYAGNNLSLNLAANTVLDILNISPSSSTDPNSAIYSPGTCNNTRDIFIGSTKYSACTGGGNVCILFSDLVAAGGTAEPTAGVTAGSTVNGSNACFPFGLNVTVSGSGTVVSYLWTQMSGPGTATITNPTTATPTISTATVSGSYTFSVAIVVSAVPQGSNCTSTSTITVTNSITLSVFVPILATGGGTPQIMSGSLYMLLAGAVTVTGTSPTYSWSENGAGTITGGNTSLTPTYQSVDPSDKGNVISLILTASNPGCSDTALYTLLVRTKLPIDLLSFSGLSESCSNKLDWQVANARNFKQFEVQVSKNAIDFKTIGVVPAVPANGFTGSNLNHDYRYQDPNGTQGNHYYKLKMVDLDDSYEYSKMIFIKSACTDPSATLFPNPVTNAKNVQVQLANFGTNIIGQLIDITGRTIHSSKFSNGDNLIDISSFQSGVYWLRIQDEAKREQVLKLTVTR